MKILLILAGLFYSILCVFSIVTGIIYMSGKRKLNPLELSDNFVKKLDTEEKLNNFTRKMGLVTFIVGIVQGVTAHSIFIGNNIFFYCISIGFTGMSWLTWDLFFSRFARRTDGTLLYMGHPV